MITTDWKEFRDPSDPKSVYRVRATYGLHKIGDQEPYVSVTGQTERRPARGGRWQEDTAGMLHDTIARHFPKLRNLLPWHLTFVNSGPMHYEANAVYWWEQGDLDHFKSTIVFGGAPRHDASGLPIGSITKTKVREWLAQRKPELMKNLHAVLKKHNLI